MKKAPSRIPYKILSIDPWLQPYYNEIALRMERNNDVRRKLLGDKADLVSFANGYMYYGFNRTDSGWVYREWLPGADEVHLIGDFNEWNRTSHPLKRIDNANWEICLEGADALQHGQRVKNEQRQQDDQRQDRGDHHRIREEFFPLQRCALTGFHGHSPLWR